MCDTLGHNDQYDQYRYNGAPRREGYTHLYTRIRYHRERGMMALCHYYRHDMTGCISSIEKIPCGGDGK